MQDLLEKLKHETAKGEKILWQGQAEQGLKLMAVHLIYIAIGLNSLNIFFDAGPVPEDATMQVRVFALFYYIVLPTSIFCLAIALFLPWGAAKIRKNTLYAITDERLIIIDKKGTHSTPIKSIKRVSTVPHFSGTETIFFEIHKHDFPNFTRHKWLYGITGLGEAPHFKRLENVSDVENVFREAVKAKAMEAKAA